MAANSRDQSIENVRSRLEQTRDKAEALVLEHKRVVAMFLDDWANYLIDRAIRDKPQISKDLGKEKLGKMKSEFRELLEAYPDLTAAEHEEEVFWLHRAEIPEDITSNPNISYDLAKQKRESLDEAIRLLIGRVGALLIKFGFVSSAGGSEWKSVRGGALRYSYGITTYGIADVDQLDNVRKEYDQIVEEYVKTARKVRMAEQKKETAEARDL